MILNNDFAKFLPDDLRNLVYIPDPNSNTNPNIGLYSEKIYNIDNVEDYLNFSWKYDDLQSNFVKDKFTWLDTLSEDTGSHSQEELSSHYNELFHLSIDDNNLKNCLFGSSKTDEDESWKLADTNPLKTTLLLPGVEGYLLNTNWYERLQSSYRNISLFDKGDNMSLFNIEQDHNFLKEVGLFYNESKIACLILLKSLLSSNLSELPNGFIEITDETYPRIYKFYKPKFKNDRLFIHDGILFTLVIGDNDAFSNYSYTECKKIYSNDFKGKQALCHAIHSLGKSKSFSIPIVCVIDYMAIRVIAEPLIPLSNDAKFLLDSLIGFESDDHDIHNVMTRILSIKTLSNDLYMMSKSMKLSSLPLPFAASDYKNTNINNNCNAVESNGHLHFINTQEVLPPWLDYESKRMCHYRLREEFIRFYFDKSLKCSLKSQPVFDSEFDNNIFKEATEQNIILIKNNIHKFYSITGSWDLSNTLHSFGINMKNIGLIYENTKRSALSDVLGAEMASRAFKHVWEAQIQILLISKELTPDSIDSIFLDLVNSFLGLSENSIQFWSNKIHPLITNHFNLIDAKPICFDTIPKYLLKAAIENNMGVVLPNFDYRNTKATPIRMDDFKSLHTPDLFSYGIPSDYKSQFYPKVSVSYPKYNLKIFKAASSMCNSEGLYGYGFLINSCSLAMGLPANIKSKILGTGYPCDPICVYNAEILCNGLYNSVVGTYLYALVESELLYSHLTRFKLLLNLGYSFFQHRFYSNAVKVAEYLVENTKDILPLYIESMILLLQCYTLTGQKQRVKDDYEILVDMVYNFESFNGFLKLQILIIISYYWWINKEYQKCLSNIENSMDSYLDFFTLKNYEWVPTFLLSLIGCCTKELKLDKESLVTNYQLSKYVKSSDLPSYTIINMQWLFLESTIRASNYKMAIEISSKLLSEIKAEYSDSSMEYLRGLYISAWVNRQVGAVHFLYPYLYLRTSDREKKHNIKRQWFEDDNILMEMISESNNSVDNRNRLTLSLRCYITLLDMFYKFSEENNKNILDVLREIDPDFSTEKLKNNVNITRQCLLNNGSDKVLKSMDDPFLKIYLDNADVFQTKIMLIGEQFLTLKLVSLDTVKCYIVANKLYNAYASQVSCEYTRQLAAGPTIQYKHQLEKSRTGNLNIMRTDGESLSSHVSIKNNIIPRSGHDLRSIELLLLGEPVYNKNDICDMCIRSCRSGRECDDWFYSIFEIINNRSDLTREKLSLSVDILRNFSTPSLSLFILGHLANISNSDLKQTLSFKSFKKTMNRS
ncbi:hypothetical protein MACJ_003971 [Theileria orientalis]|uniref:Clu domain-containing protein n=1 Tax=Theileria orientalis TaxID=68886 RepID=A0A976XJG0_THEOR|nr:hypothetical protein MACJ_003971 [Theileria orientalis]